jgi:glucose/arabinose dehydrogenase
MIERSQDNGITWSTVQSNTGTTSTIYLDAGLSPSTTYTYRVSAVYAGGMTSPPSNTTSAITQSTTYKLTVSTQLITGDTLVGLYSELRNSTGQIAATGFSPATFVLNNGAQYTIGMGNYATDVFDHWADTGSTTNPRSVSISSDTQLTAVYRDTAITLAPSRGPVGTNVTATGINNAFLSNTSITLSWDGTALTTVTSNSTGGFTTTFQVPSDTTGSHKVQATDGTNTHSALFTVGPSPVISLNTNSANVGTGVRVTGINFTPLSQITISYDGTAIGVGQQNVDSGSTVPSIITTDSSGKFVAIISVLRSITGAHTISSQDATNNVSSQNIIVSPHVFIYPTSGHAGSQVLIPASQGNGFAANSAITIKFNGTTMLSSAISTDSAGNFGGSFTIPSGSSIGKYQIQVSDASGNMYFTPFNVTSSTSPTYSVQRIVTGMSMPDSFAFVPDKGPGIDGSGAFMVTEKNTGNVIVFKNVNGQFVRQTVPFVTIPNLQTGAEDVGVLGITFDPNWDTKMVYFYVTRNVTGTTYGEVIRYHATTDLSGNIIADQSVGEQLVLGNIHASKTGHNGGHLKFDSQGNLYISTGDGWTFTAGQDLTTMQAKMLRITPLAVPSNGQLYSIPSTNPFASSTNTSIKKEIWGYGVRNPYTFDIDSQTGRLYVSDVGYNTWERIDDFTTASANAGWPNYESPPFGNPQSLTNYTPQVYWLPHQGAEPLTGSTAGLQALTAGVFYHGTNYPSNLQGAYFFGDYGIGFIAALLPSSTASPAIDPASGYPIGKVMPILYGLTEAPINMQVWNGKVYFLELTGNMDVLNYN